MNRRQRKKHRRGEFQQLGFELRFCTPADWSDAEQTSFGDVCIRKVGAFELAVGGGTGVCWNVFVTGSRNRDSVTPAQREALLGWLAAHPAVSDIRPGELEDAWYPRNCTLAAVWDRWPRPRPGGD